MTASVEQSVISVGVIGALGKMGREVVKTVLNENAMTCVLAIDRTKPDQSLSDVLLCPVPESLTVDTDLQSALNREHPDVVVDFTAPNSVFNNAKIALELGIRCVIGTTGLTQSQLSQLDAIAREHHTAVFVVPNFSIGGVLMMRFAQEASRYFGHAEIIELHHNQKLDAPSGTSIRTAELMTKACQQFGTSNTSAEEETIMGARGAQGPGQIQIHSVRLPGLVAHQEVLLGATGELLTLRHDSFDRRCFMPGVMLAIRYVMNCNGLLIGLENAMGKGE